MQNLILGSPLLAILWIGSIGSVQALAAEPDLVVADFEGDDYGDWTATGEAFGPAPAEGTLPGQMDVSGFRGRRLVNSFYGGDKSRGTLTSPPFAIERPYINFLIGGGQHPQEACINLVVDEEVVRSATGPNDRPGGSERLDWHCWDVSELIGREAILEIVDQCQGGWGHINVDQIVQSDKKKAAEPAERSFRVEKRYLHLPVEKGAPKVRMSVTVGAETVDDFHIELAPAEADFWVFLDMGPYQGESATIHADRLAPDSRGLDAVLQSDKLPGEEKHYKETYRPQFHFSPRRGWNNDPNGLVYHKGLWHLYFQHNPYGWAWGNMHWGHAVSPDLVHWRELPIAIYPYEFGDWAFSGSAVVDRDNTAGFKQDDEDVIIAAYTSTGRGEAIAYSNDGGRTFTEYEGNPVVEHAGRDPKIIWYAPGKHWVMAVYDEHEGSRGIAFYTSRNLKEWQFASRIDGYYECPEIFELPIDDDEGNTRWVVYAADGAYAIGSFDGKTFTPDHEGKHRFNWGDCFYASQTFSDVPEEDGRRVQIAWGRTGHPDMPFNQQMNFPVELTLRSTEEGVRMFAEPVDEIERLHTASHHRARVALDDQGLSLTGLESELLHIEVDLAIGDAERMVLAVRGEEIVYDCVKQTLQCQGKSAPLASREGRITLEVLVDRLSIEIFAGNGRLYMPMRAVLEPEDLSFRLRAEGGTATLDSLNVHELESAWK